VWRTYAIAAATTFHIVTGIKIPPAPRSLIIYPAGRYIAGAVEQDCFVSDFLTHFCARLAACLIAAATALFGAGAMAQNAAIPVLSPPGAGWLEIGDDFLPPPSGPGPVTADPAHPYHSNISGLQPTYRVANLNNPLLKPWVVERLRQTNERVLSGHVPFQAHERCWPTGVPGFEVFSLIRPIYFLQTPKEVLIINEGDFQVRHVYLNVPHSKNPKLSWYGESVGHYEHGDTLVVDTIGMNDKSFVDNYLTPHTTQLHTVERFQVTDGGKSLRVFITADDPGAFTAPWSAVQVYRLQHRGNGDWDEDICAENNSNYFSYDMAPMPQSSTPDF
jgi:hypothetical protein